MSEFNIINNTVSTTDEVNTMETTSGENIIGGEEANSEENVMSEETIMTEENIETGETDAVSEEGDIQEIIGDGTVDGTVSEPVTGEGEFVPGDDEGYVDPGFTEGEDMYAGMETATYEVKDPLLSSWPFVIGISAAVLVVSIALGAFLARLKIKKGIDLYED